ncbi:hypothetical protein EZV62_017379 [Acer yangbiense]|uniref:Nucleoporin Nup54 alpha-helical domain-containing protein n=1 Tax=Acer yangbiense TaxID=1000413 RepID=A0A5C7HIR8_9ROSI|nr:hypothetical protein EZV62_017379 [Acer yangbiense]
MNGPIPETVGQLTELEVLNLSGNSWEGVVTENHLQNLTRLTNLPLLYTSKSLVFNVRHDWIAPFSLSHILFIDCQLGLAFPSWLRTQIIGVDFLVLSNVAISDEIPDWFWKSLSPRLIWLDLSNNQLRGKLPRSINVQHDVYIDLRSNLLEGSIPLWKNVKSLSLRNNLLSGAIPLNIGHEMSGLTDLDLSRNSVTGSIPASMGEMKNLRFLDLSHNYISGEIPLNWHNLEQLWDVDLSSNNLSGGIPSSICSLPSLLLLELSSNNLSEELSVSLQDCKVHMARVRRKIARQMLEDTNVPQRELQDDVIVSDAERLRITQSNVKMLQRHFQAETLPWIQRMRQKEQSLQRRLLRVGTVSAMMRIIEALAELAIGKGYRLPLMKGEAELAEKLAGITRQLKGSGAVLSRRVQNLLTVSRVQANGIGAGGSIYLPGSTKIHEQSLADMQEVLQQQTEAIARLGNVLKRDIRDMEIIMPEDTEMSEDVS